MATLDIMIGLPGSGKSTIRQLLLADAEARGLNTAVISSDDLLEAYAKERNITYGAAFTQYSSGAVQRMNALADQAMNNCRRIIWDQTNLSSAKRMGIIERAKNARCGGTPYIIRYHLVEAPWEEIVARNNARRATERDVPLTILTGMKQSFSFGIKELDVVSEIFYYGTPGRFKQTVENVQLEKMCDQ